VLAQWFPENIAKDGAAPAQKAKLVSAAPAPDARPTPKGGKRRSGLWWGAAAPSDSADVHGVPVPGPLSGQQSLTIGLVIAASTAWLGRKYWKA